MNFKKILDQTSPMGINRKGLYENPISVIEKILVTPANNFEGSKAVYTETSRVLHSCDMHPFIQKRWLNWSTEETAEFVLQTDEKLNFDFDNDDRNDEIQYNDVRYRIVKMRHNDRKAFDDNFEYALRRKLGQEGGL